MARLAGSFRDRGHNDHNLAMNMDLGVFFYVDVSDDCAILERHQNSATTKASSSS